MLVSCTAEMETIQLTPNNFRELKLLVQPVAAYWKNIADGIGMEEYVPTIERTHANMTPADCLRDLLIRWLNMEGPHTLETICQALKSDHDIQGREKVVSNLEKEFCK